MIREFRKSTAISSHNATITPLHYPLLIWDVTNNMAERTHVTFTIRNYPFRVMLQGKGQPGTPTMFLVHDIGASAAAWTMLAQYYRGRLGVVAPDLLGHGGSHISDRYPLGTLF